MPISNTNPYLNLSKTNAGLFDKCLLATLLQQILSLFSRIIARDYCLLNRKPRSNRVARYNMMKCQQRKYNYYRGSSIYCELDVTRGYHQIKLG